MVSLELAVYLVTAAHKALTLRSKVLYQQLVIYHLLATTLTMRTSCKTLATCMCGTAPHGTTPDRLLVHKV